MGGAGALGRTWRIWPYLAHRAVLGSNPANSKGQAMGFASHGLPECTPFQRTLPWTGGTAKDGTYLPIKPLSGPIRPVIAEPAAAASGLAPAAKVVIRVLAAVSMAEIGRAHV